MTRRGPSDAAGTPALVHAPPDGGHLSNADDQIEAIEVVRCGYDRVSSLYRPDDADPESYRPWIDEILRRLPLTGRVLDLGCGNGIPVAKSLAAAGHEVVGVDFSSRQIERARGLVTEATFLQADITEHDLGTECFDAVVALYSLIHLPLAAQPVLIGRMADALVDGGFVVATVGWDAWSGRDPNWSGWGAAMSWSQADHATYQRWMNEVHFDVERVERVPDGGSSHALIVASRRPRR